ncbi:hypothetical protein L1049_017422 [Liquidambar formosana]|uniref:Response regulatory domain-containing protein n=1 Tax=Liquidambar formosana TaxID=63359 RepID=A0AAP0S0T8_LIQFO
MDISTKDNGRFPLEMRTFRLHSMIKEAACLAKCLCVYRGFSFAIEVEKSLPDHVMGDERRVFQVILHMVGNLLNGGNAGGFVTFRVSSESRSEGSNDKNWATWRPSLSDGYVHIKFEIAINNYGSQSEGSMSSLQLVGRRYTSDGVEQGLSFSMCKKLVQMMQGNIWVVPNPQGFAQSMALALQFQLQPPIGISFSEPGESSDHPHSNTLFRGLQVLLADEDDMNRAVTRKLLEKLGCAVSAVSSGFECLSAIGPAVTPFKIILLDLHMPDLDGFEVARRIRKFRSRNWPLIIALTANADEELRERCLQSGMNGVIRKPVLLQGIADELRRVLLQASKVMS